MDFFFHLLNETCASGLLFLFLGDDCEGEGVGVGFGVYVGVWLEVVLKVDGSDNEMSLTIFCLNGVLVSELGGGGQTNDFIDERGRRGSR